MPNIGNIHWLTDIAFLAPKEQNTEYRSHKEFTIQMRVYYVLTSSRSTKPAIFPPLAQMFSNTLSTFLFTLHLVFPSVSRACNVPFQKKIEVKHQLMMQRDHIIGSSSTRNQLQNISTTKRERKLWYKLCSLYFERKKITQHS